MPQHPVKSNQNSNPLGYMSVPLLVNTRLQRSSETEGYHIKILRGLSVIHTLLGCLVILIQIWDMINHSLRTVICTGIWTGPIFIIAGSLGIISSDLKSTFSLVSFLVVSIIASVVTMFLLIPNAIKIGEYSHMFDSNNTSSNSFQHEQEMEGSRTTLQMIIAVSAVMIFISLIQAVVAIVSSCIACRALGYIEGTTETLIVQGHVQYGQISTGQSQMVVAPMVQPGHALTQVTSKGESIQPQHVTTATGSTEKHVAGTLVHHQLVQPPPYYKALPQPPMYDTGEFPHSKDMTDRNE